MPLNKKWSKYSKENVSNIVNNLGVYEIANSKGETVYIGQGKIRDRLNEHFLIGSHPIPQGAQFRYKETNSKERAEQRERVELDKYEKQTGKPPRYNRRKE